MHLLLPPHLEVKEVTHRPLAVVVTAVVVAAAAVVVVAEVKAAVASVFQSAVASHPVKAPVPLEDQPSPLRR
jgi:hypothetical protein